ncbi:hypothetical protein LCGC14_0362060 [marine sediment metagenome]|uniref:Uncharacterized protein n=1 Tax=marine sediment metagenome TaxID=412755 RepID=A0A0F9WFW2_9ZZZZ
MSNQIKVGHFEADGGIINLPVGFVPDYFQMHDVGEGTNPDMFQWFRQQQTHEATGSQEGMLTNGADGVITLMADDAGITAYNTGQQTPPIGIWEASSATIDERDGTSLTITARTADAPGTYVNPTVGSTTDRQAIFEAVTVSGNTGSTEPTWPDSIGENVTDGSVVWKRVDVSLQRGGYQGVVIQDDINTDSREMYYLALQADQLVDHGDTAGWTDGIDPNA